MHELAVTESIHNIALKHAIQANAARVTDIYLVIGQLSSIVDDSVQFYWDFISQNSLCSGATLHFQRVPAEMRCLDCQHTFKLANDLGPCPQCGSAHLKIIAGEEFWVDSIQIEPQE